MLNEIISKRRSIGDNIYELIFTVPIWVLQIHLLELLRLDKFGLGKIPLVNFKVKVLFAFILLL